MEPIPPSAENLYAVPESEEGGIMPNRVMEVSTGNTVRLVWWQILPAMVAWFLVFVLILAILGVTDNTHKDLDKFSRHLDRTDVAIQQAVSRRLRLQIETARKVGLTDAQIATALLDDPEALEVLRKQVDESREQQ